MKTGIIGSGRISGQYIRNMMDFYSGLEVVACSAVHPESAERRAAEFGIAARTTEEILADPAIELVVILVPTPAHGELITRALAAGKHVYVEKTLAATAEEACRALDLAREKGLALGAAPDTFLGAAWQRARQAIDEGLIGVPLSFSLNINRNIDYVASLFEFTRLPGSGFAYDYGVYYLTVLVSLLGPVRDVYAVVRNRAEVRINCAPESPEFGQPYAFPNESQVYALMNLENGIPGTVSMNGDSNLADTPFFYIYGTRGILKLPCANDFGGAVEIMENTMQWAPGAFRPLECPSPITGERRGIGPAEMARAIRQGRPHRASGEMAFHVLDVIEQMERSSAAGQPMKVMSTCARPEPLTGEELKHLLAKP